MTNTSVGRFQLLDKNQLQLPHKCSVCGGTGLSEERKFVDFDLWVEFYGVVYICDQCFRGAAEVVNCIPKSVYNMIKQQLTESQEVIKQLIRENGDLRNAVDAFRNLSGTNIGSGIKYWSPDMATEKAIDDDSTGIAEGEEGSVQQTDEQGPPLIHSNDSDAKPIRLPADTFSELGLNI